LWGEREMEGRERKREREREIISNTHMYGHTEFGVNQ
jgi:hypothetical protein